MDLMGVGEMHMLRNPATTCHATETPTCLAAQKHRCQLQPILLICNRKITMALDALFFDVDGTLVDSNALHVEAFVKAFDARGYKVLPDRIAIEMGKGGDQLVPAILGPSADEKDGDAIREAEPEEFSKLAAAKGISIFPRARELLETVRRRGMTVVIVTSSAKKQLQTIEKYSGLAISSLADLIVTADDAAKSKPAPDLVAAAVKKAKLSPAQCGMVGDRIYDVRSARHAGVTSIGLLCGGNSADHLLEAGARRVCKDPAELLTHLDESLAALSPSRSHLTVHATERLIHEALESAEEAMQHGEVPIGCVIALGDGTVIGRGWNQFNQTRSKIAHAEIVALTDAAKRIPTDAEDLIMVSTLEPCVMCTGAAMEAGIDTILFALSAPADSGSSRVTPPRSPDVKMPRVIGNVLSTRSLKLFEKWLTSNANSQQAPYVKQLVNLHNND
jgi:HAD superfamily hydrolase (TIGR01509 family)